MFLRKNSEINRKILELLKQNCKMPVKDIAKSLRMPMTTVHSRIKKMERDGLIKGYTVQVDYSKLGKPVQAFVTVSLAYSPLNSVSYPQLMEQITSLQGIEQCYIISGKYDVMLFVAATDVNALNDFIAELRKIDGVTDTRTSIIMTDIFDNKKEGWEIKTDAKANKPVSTH